MAADSDNEMRDFTDSEGEQERWEEKTGTRAGIGLIKVQAVLRTEHLRKGYLPLKCVFLVTFSLPQTTLDRSLRVLPRQIGRS